MDNVTSNSIDELFDLTDSITEDSALEEEDMKDTIEPVSPTLLVDESTSRFSDAIWAEEIKKKEVVLAGVGGIGSYVAFLLSRVRPSIIYLYDPDRVDGTNLSGQLYSWSDVGDNKINAISSIMGSFSSYYNIVARPLYYTQNYSKASIMMCGFDNMSARKEFYNAWRNYVARHSNPKECLFIDGRLAAEEFQVFCIKGDDEYHMKQYEEKWLFSDEEAEATICSYKQTSHCANMIASIMVNLFVNFVANQCEPLIERDVPFLTSYDASTMYFKTIV